jgi:hypothetical protein
MDKPIPWFVPHLRNVHSQFGEDGILEELFARLGVTSKWCVEFGAADGRYFSNSRHFILEKGFAAVLIEGNRTLHSKLVKTYADNPLVIPKNAFVGFEPHDGLDVLLQATPVPTEFDFLSIDIDGNDYWVWEKFQKYRPRVVILEFNPTIPTQVEFVQPRDMHASQGSSLLSLTKLGQTKGYELVAVTHCNAIFVTRELFPRLDLADNSPWALRVDEKAVTYLFCGFDGRVMLRGACRLPWHRLALKEFRCQPLPFFLRRYPGNYNLLQRALAQLHRSLYKKRII